MMDKGHVCKDATGIKAVIFDLDDTLYQEMDYVRSGFRAVDACLASCYGYEEGVLSGRMMEILDRDGRGKVFDALLQEKGRYSEGKVAFLVDVYRSHSPAIRPFPEVREVMASLRREGMSLGIITDGLASVQRLKVKALGFADLFDQIIYTDDFGRECWKPSPVPFQAALEGLGIKPCQAIYVGDNLKKDFIGPNILGMASIHLNRNNDKAKAAANREIPESYPRFTVTCLKEILSVLADSCSWTTLI